MKPVVFQGGAPSAMAAVALRDGYVITPVASAEYAVLVRAMIAHYQKIGKAASIKLD